MSEDDLVTLGRIDERIKALQTKLGEVKAELDKYVLHIRFRPVEMGFYGLVSIICAAVVAAMVALVIHK